MAPLIVGSDADPKRRRVANIGNLSLVFAGLGQEGFEREERRWA
jgi:hypothetical protein